MSNGTELSSAIRIVELNLADPLEILERKKALPIEFKSTAPRAGGLCEGIIAALQARTMDMDPAQIYADNTLTLFPREKKITYDRSVAGHDVFVVLDFPLPDTSKVTPQTFLLAASMVMDNYIMLAQQAAHAAKNNGANSVHLIMPSYPYARQDKNHGQRGPITASIVARNLEPFFDSLTSVHLHSPAICGMFRGIPLAEISPKEIYTPTFVLRRASDLAPMPLDHLSLDGVNALFKKLCIVSPDAGGVKNAREFAEYAQLWAATLLDVEPSQIVSLPVANIDKRRQRPNESEVMNVLGKENVKGRIAVVVDDMGDTFGTATNAAAALVGAGAKGVEFWGTHGYFSGSAVQRIENSAFIRISITNATALDSAVLALPELQVLDIAPVMAQVIIDHVTRPGRNLHIANRHLDANNQHREALGRYVFTMTPHP